MDKRPGFWPVYEKVQAVDKVSVFNLIVEVGAEVGEPYQQPERGRKHKLSAVKEGAVLAFCMYYDYTHGGLAVDAPGVFGVRFDQSLLSHYADRVPVSWLMTVSERVDGLVDWFDPDSVGILDSTEFAKDTHKSVKRVFEEVRQKETVKEHILVKYRPNSGLTTVKASETTKAKAGDSPAAQKLLPVLKPHEVIAMFGDSAYDVEAIFKICYLQLMAMAIICEHKGREKGFYRRKARKDYDNQMRKQYRGMVEGVFGATTVKYDNKIRWRTHEDKELAAIILSYNLHALLKAKILHEFKGEKLRKGDGRLRTVRLFAQLKQKIRVTVLIFHQPQSASSPEYSFYDCERPLSGCPHS